jgi:hypothetical protein
MIMLRLTAIAAVILAASAAPSLASFGLMCEGPDGVIASIPLGGGVGLHPLGAEIKAAGQTWTTEEGVSGTIEMAPAQSAEVGNQLYIDFADPNFEAVIAEIRLFWAMEGDEPVYGGTLRVAGHGAWPITCGMG